MDGFMNNYCLTNGKIKVEVPKNMSISWTETNFDDIVKRYQEYYRIKRGEK